MKKKRKMSAEDKRRCKEIREATRRNRRAMAREVIIFDGQSLRVYDPSEINSKQKPQEN